jgi:hypothetical protein
VSENTLSLEVMIMKSTFNWSLILAGVALSGGMALAQPGNPPKGDNPPPNARPPRPRMTPEERRKETEDRLRAVMTDNGVTDTATQDAVLAYLANDLQARNPLRQMGIKLQRALSDKDVSDDQIKGMIADYQNAQALENQRRTKAQSDLDTQIHYTQNPRLEGLLMLMGVLGDGPPLMEGPRRPNDNQRPPQPPENNQEERRQKMLQMFDKNGDGKLDAQERAAMQAYRQQQRAERGNADNPPPPPPNNGPADNDDN